MIRTFQTRERERASKVHVKVFRVLSVCCLALSLGAGSPLTALAAEAQAVEAQAVESEMPALRSTIIQTELNHPQTPTVHSGDVREVAPGTVLDIVLTTEITADENTKGDVFLGKISKDVLVGEQVVIPRGTMVHGVLSSFAAPKRSGRDGFMNARFDYLITPDGRKVTINGDATTRDSKGKAAARVVGRAAGFTAIGGVVGTVMALQLGGLAGAAASHGASLAGGAAIGGATGLTIALLTKGKSVVLPPGSEMRVKIGEALKLPTMTMPDETAEDFCISGLKPKLAGVRVHRHPSGEMTEITLTLDVLNQTDYTFSTFEIGLEDELGNLFFPSTIGDMGVLSSKIKPNSHFSDNVTFSVYNAKMRHKLIFFKPFSREPVARMALTDSLLASVKARPRSKRAEAEAYQHN